MNSAHSRPFRRRPVLLAAMALALVAATGALIAAARPGQADAPGPLLPPCAAASPLPCYAQDPLHQVYDMGGLYEHGITGAGTAIAVIVPYLDPWLGHDLAVYSRRFRLPAPRLHVIDAGHAPAARPGNRDAAAWTQEATADLEVAHFMAPGAQLVYVGIAPTGDAEATAMAALSWLVTHTQVDVVSFSWGEYEPQISQAPRPQRYLATLRAALTAAARAHVTVVAASGDSGPTMPSLTGGLAPGRAVAWPAGDPLVTAVGSAAVHASSSGVRLRPDTVAGDDGNRHATGSGRSVLYSRPSWQDRAASVVGGHRGVADIAMSLSAWVYTHFNVFPHHRPGWNALKGTSISAPMFAGLVACAAQLAGHSLGVLGPVLYRLRGSRDGVLDITHGTNTLPAAPGFSATPGYGVPSGIGTVGDAARFAAALAGGRWAPAAHNRDPVYAALPRGPVASTRSCCAGR